MIYERPKLGEAAPVVPPPVVRRALGGGDWGGNYENTEVPPRATRCQMPRPCTSSLIGPAGFKKEHVLLFTDTTEKRPTLQNIKWALGTFLARSAGKDDTVVIFFAGHGAPEVDPRGIEADGLAKYLSRSTRTPMTCSRRHCRWTTSIPSFPASSPSAWWFYSTPATAGRQADGPSPRRRRSWGRRRSLPGTTHTC